MDLPDRIGSLPEWPRGMRLPVAAAYVGVSENTFRRQVAAGVWPQPTDVEGIKLWDRKALDEAFDRRRGNAASSRSGDWDEAFDGIGDPQPRS